MRHRKDTKDTEKNIPDLRDLRVSVVKFKPIDGFRRAQPMLREEPYCIAETHG